MGSEMAMRMERWRWGFVVVFGGNDVGGVVYRKSVFC